MACKSDAIVHTHRNTQARRLNFFHALVFEWRGQVHERPGDGCPAGLFPGLHGLVVRRMGARTVVEAKKYSHAKSNHAKHANENPKGTLNVVVVGDWADGINGCDGGVEQHVD